MYPLVLSHDLIQSFKFWYQNELHEGMCSSREMYRLSSTYRAQDRQKAFCLAVALSEQGSQVCVTCSRHEYKVWVNLRTQCVATPAPAPKATAMVM